MVLVLEAAGCGSTTTPPTHPRRSSVRVRAFTETSPVRAVVSAGNYVFAAAASGLDRWEPGSGALLPLSADHGLPGNHVRALAVDASRRWVWVATDGGVGYYDLGSETFVEIPPAPNLLELDLAARATDAGGSPRLPIAAAADGGLWLGHPRGLFYTNPAGQWISTGIVEPVTAIHVADDGWMWIGTPTGVIGREPDGRTFRFGVDQGCDVVAVRFIERAPGGGVMVVGDNAAGKQRVALRKSSTWTSYRVSPDVRWDAAASSGQLVVVMAGDRLYEIAARTSGRRRPLRRNGSRLLPATGDALATAPLVVADLDVRLPAGSASLAVHGGEIFVGTRDVGIARFTVAGGAPAGWLRRGEMLADATSMTVACVARDDCLIATGARQAWRWRGDRFESAGPVDQVMLAVVAAPGGGYFGLHRGSEDRRITVSRVDGEVWTPVGIELTTPGQRPEISFARFAPSGILWIGLRYRDGNEMRPWGVALIDVSIGAVAYHHATIDRREAAQGVLPVPIGSVDAAFLPDDEVWLATSEGAVRLVGTKLTLYSESDGLESEMLRAVAATPGGMVFVASRAGVGTFDGERWTFPRELAFPINDLALAPDGRLWMGTERGVALFDGRRVRRVDVRRGLLENRILDVAVDELGRVWARGPTSVTLISP